jgi:hypothetical protein
MTRHGARVTWVAVVLLSVAGSACAEPTAPSALATGSEWACPAGDLCTSPEFPPWWNSAEVGVRVLVRYPGFQPISGAEVLIEIRTMDFEHPPERVRLTTDSLGRASARVTYCCGVTRGRVYLKVTVTPDSQFNLPPTVSRDRIFLNTSRYLEIVYPTAPPTS